MLSSQLCKEGDFQTEWFQKACTKLRHPLFYHRKLWEYCFIYQALLERGMLEPNMSGLGFGVGKEPLVSLFASHGCHITATDLDVERAKAQGWVDSNQHSNSLADLNKWGICHPEQFGKLVTFENLDMNKLSDKYYNRFDYTWSSCSFEHLGSLKLGKLFIINQMKCLRPGGVAIHTTEFNLSSNRETIDHSVTVLFRKQDIDWMVDTLWAEGHSIEVDYTIGTGPLEAYVDLPPYRNDVHLRLMIDRFVTTSVGLIITKAKK